MTCLLAMLAGAVALPGCDTSEEPEPIGSCESPAAAVGVRTAGDLPTIAAVETGDCAEVIWCSNPNPDGGRAPCATLDLRASATCRVTFVSVTGARVPVSITVRPATEYTYRCRESRMIYEITPLAATPSSIVVQFP